MRFKRLKISVVLLFGLSFSGLLAQETVNAAGVNAVGTGGSASCSVGQVVYTTNIGTNGSVAQGVQQPYEISVTTGVIEDAEGIQLAVSVYPNPATDYLILKIEGYELSNLSFQIYDISGKIFQNGQISANITSIVVGNLASGTFFVKIIDKNKEVKLFKIIKI